jgi:predicted regulator of Ras-like GTPase activity (Roadblock/LC7/MglB family)
MIARRLLRLAVVAGFLAAATAHADVDDGWALPGAVEKTFQALVREVNENHALGEFVTLKDVRIEGTRVRLLLVDVGHRASVTVVLEHRRNDGDGFARFFDHHVEQGAPAVALDDTVSRLGPLLDAEFPADPWMLSSRLPRRWPVVRGGPVDDFRLRSRAVVLGGAVLVLLLTIGVLVALVRRSDSPPARSSK